MAFREIGKNTAVTTHDIADLIDQGMVSTAHLTDDAAALQFGRITAPEYIAAIAPYWQGADRVLFAFPTVADLAGVRAEAFVVITPQHFIAAWKQVNFHKTIQVAGMPIADIELLDVVTVGAGPLTGVTALRVAGPAGGIIVALPNPYGALAQALLTALSAQ